MKNHWQEGFQLRPVLPAWLKFNNFIMEPIMVSVSDISLVNIYYSMRLQLLPLAIFRFIHC